MRIMFTGHAGFCRAGAWRGARLPAMRVVAVYTQPPRAWSRGFPLSRTNSPVQLYAEVQRPAGVHAAKPQNRLRRAGCASKSFNVEAAVVVAYGLILPKAYSPRRHASAASIFTPRCFRAGAAPRRSSGPSWRETPRPGSPIMRYRAGARHGAVCLAERTPIWRQTKPRVNCTIDWPPLGAELMVKALGDLARRVRSACWPQHGSGDHLRRQDRAVRNAH